MDSRQRRTFRCSLRTITAADNRGKWFPQFLSDTITG
jgi:hypothetical protein